jgi:membrane associated rhomboid family serine protease
MSYQYGAPPLTKINKIILITTAVFFLVHSIFNAVGAFDILYLFGLSTQKLMHGHLWQLITYPFMETQLMSFLFNGLLIWFVGSELEGLWGQKVYLRFLLIVVCGVGIIFSAVNVLFFFGTTASYSAPLFGLTGVNFALLIAYSMLYPDRQLSMMMIFPMRARTFCWVLIGIEAYMAIFSGLITAWAHLLAMGISYLVIRFQTKPLIRKMLNSTFQPKKQSKNHLYVVKDDDQGPPKFWQ